MSGGYSGLCSQLLKNPCETRQIPMAFHPDNLIDQLIRPFNLRFADDEERVFLSEQNRELRKHLLQVLTGMLAFGFFIYLTGIVTCKNDF